MSNGFGIGGRSTSPVSPKADGVLGLSKREYFAGLAMQGIITGALDSAINAARRLSKPEEQVVAIIAVTYADAMLEELEKTNDQ